MLSENIRCTTIGSRNHATCRSRYKN